MKNTTILKGGLLLASMASLSFATPRTSNDQPEAKTDTVSVVTTQAPDSVFSGKLADAGLNPEAWTEAIQGYKKLMGEGKVGNDKYLTIVDFSQNSRSKRFYVVDMQSDSLVMNTYVAHGKNSGFDEASSFSNQLNSEKSSLGFYLTKTVYNGKHGESLRLSGQESGINDQAEARGIVVHGASYVSEERATTAYMGRSQGCPALPEKDYARAINMIRDGSVMFIYSPNGSYQQQSSLLNM